jgi:thymidylate synthase (FAD)
MMNKINVLDNGYIRLVDTLGTDLSVVNAARVSYDKESAEFEHRDKQLLGYLIRNNHTSPLRHAALTFEVYAPLFVARQWWKYAVASTHIDDQNGWNESSRRYITEEEEFYIPLKDQWRSAPENSKQGSGEPINEDVGYKHFGRLLDTIIIGTKYYHEAMEDDVAPELARLFLPAYGMYVRWRWTVSLQGVLTFLDQRLEHDAQWEIQKYAEAVLELSRNSFPETIGSIYEPTENN